MDNSLSSSINSTSVDENASVQTNDSDGEMQIANIAHSSGTKPKKTRALVYKFFEWKEEFGQYECKICQKKYSLPKLGGTGSFNNHMNRKHKSVFDSEKREKEKSDAAENGRPIQSQSPRTITREVFRHKIVMFIIGSDQPFTLVEDTFFRDLINYCSSENKECQLFCAKTAKSDIEGLYHEYKAKMKEILEKNDGKISFVIDCWTSSNQFPFQGVVARWINDEWELCTTVLDLSILKGSHEGVNIAASFWNVVKDYNLCQKLLGVTTDNAYNMDTMFEELENLALLCGVVFDSKNYRVRCFAHIMNLSCQAMIHSVGDGDSKTYSSDSESDDEESESKAEDLPVIAKLRKGVVGIRKSPQRREIFSRQCVAANIKPKVVIRDVRTRWNATLAMLERAKELREPYDLTITSISKLRKHALDDEDWEKIYELINLLAPFQEATVMLSNEHSPTISRISGVYQVLFDHLEKYVKSDSDDTGLLPSKRAKRSDIQKYPTWLVEAAQRGFDKLEKYYPSSDGLVYIVGTGRCSFDEQAAIIDAVEEFICGDNLQTVLEKLRLEGNVSSVCGQIFKVGEPTYSCRECGMDQTCVLCVNCFKQSAHRNHKYKMGTSSGGGCCDCGDPEAWKRDPYCDEHNIKEEKTESSIITERMRERCLIVFDAIMNYCVRSLEIETDGSLRGCEGLNEEDLYCTVLYNDETHTFEQVIQTLTRIVGCNQKEAVEYVSSIDREGRAVMKCATFQACLKLKQDIEKQTMRTQMITKTTALKVAVLQKKAVAYQQIALQLLSWFQDFLSRHAVFRKLLCEVATQLTSYNLNHILLNDFKLWKTARASWHRLLISGMLMEYENKKTLAILFTKLYPSLMQEFIRDDHEHSFSVVSLSVQIFTVPTIAQHLIAHESAFFKLMHTFYSESIEKYVKKKILQFAKNTANMNVFKRAAYTLFDLKYLLSFKPDVWTDDLRKNFLHGFQILLKLLKEMQGMDSVHRQTGQHMEYEPEWESAFNLHTKLAHVITLILDWCSTDKVVLVKVYRMVLASLCESEFIVSQATREVKELADHSAACIMYDVSAKHVSIHLPLSRFFAGLYLHLEKFGLNYELGMGQASSKPTPDLIIEPVLCTQTMIAQVHSGLWRRNGYSLLNQLYFYRNVRCRAEMLDRDIVVLQIGASLIESNEFLIHVINKFNLISWAAADFEIASLINPEEDSIRQIINMVDEMLETLIVIIGERYVPGIGVVTETDKLKKEIIQQLCIKPFSHSELSKTLPESQHENGIESVIDMVAVFKKPTQSDKKGVYELKPEFFEDYNMYYYHYTKEEKSISEEAQRKRRKDKNDLVCCPPPMLPQLTQSFSLLANLLQCDVMLLIMQTVLKRALDLKARSFSDSHLQKVLHLIGYAVQEQKTGFYPFFTFYDRESKWNILQLMEELVSSVRVEAHRDLLIWAVKAYKDLQPIFKMLVSLVFITPSVIYAKTQECSVPSGSMFDFYYLKLMFLANLTKIFLLMKLDANVLTVGGDKSNEFMDVDSEYDADELIESPLIDFYVKFNCFQRENGSTSIQGTRKLHDAILENIKAECSTFLRCSCLLFHFMTDVELPDQLANVYGDTFEVMCEYLGLRTDVKSYLSNKESYSFITSLASHKDIDNVAKSLCGNGDSVVYPCVPSVKRFIDLPDDYSDLINSVSSFTCPNNDRDDTRNPSMCLVCGDILCSMTYCCQKEMINNQTVGACTYHAQECGAGVGIFLRIRDCEIVLLGLSKGSLMSAPYLDEYGETDQGLRRGNPLHLCKERLNKLHLMWLGHSLHEEIARTTEITNSLIATQWHNM